MRGYFGIGVEGISKAMNVGSIFRTAHAFDASFVFTVAAEYCRTEGGKSDTSDAPGHLPFYSFPDTRSLVLPANCSLVGVELIEQAVELPSFRHPLCAAYILGPERGSLSPAITEKCQFVVKIPTRFCVNVGIAAAIIMYDRLNSLGRFARRPVYPGGPGEAMEKHVFGDPVIRSRSVIRSKMDRFRDTPPMDISGQPSSRRR